MRHAKAAVALASHTSHTINALVAHALTLSDNFYAEQLLAIGGGLAPVQQTAKDAGVTGTSTEADGSGLSDRDWQTAGGEVALLDYAQKSAAYTRLHNGLAVACRTGTLKHRMCGTIASGRVFAKTGTLAHTKALSGFTTDAKGRLVVFAILCDNVSDTGAASNAEDSIAVLLRSYQG
jgi:D-alanyl-D-alanine carboxypeptidase/D-alanyl-D-alanine-endopeptidase (penicillin-binding protein 4)